MSIKDNSSQDSRSHSASDARSAPFRFVIFMYRSPPVDPHVDRVAQDLLERIVGKLDGSLWKSKLRDLVVSPIIVDPSTGTIDDFAEHQKGGRVEVGSNIEYKSWMSASDAEQFALLGDCFRRCFASIKPTYLEAEDGEKVMNALQSTSK